MRDYLVSTDRKDIANEADVVAEHLKADAEVIENPEKYYDQIIEIDLSTLEPHLNGPFSPDRAWPISEFAKAVKENDFPVKLEVGLIGSCTNSSYEDLDKAASLAKQVVEKNLEVKSELIISPGSEQVRYTIQRDGQLQDLQKMGGVVLANACGPCIGQWDRAGAEKEEKNSIITSFNRNFAKRADGNPNTYAFVASPEMVTAMAISGDMTFNPLTDSLVNKNGTEVKLDPPVGAELPPKGFAVEDAGYQAPVEDGSGVEVTVSPESERLQLLTRFESWNGEDISDLKVLVKAQGKCTTDHISMAGPWLRFRGHLDNISNNLLLGATNAFNGKVNSTLNQITGEYDEIPKVAKSYGDAGIKSIIIGDENYGEGSSREHAAMEPRNRGVKVVIVKSFARIHETNLKKQGVLAFTFANPKDYDRIEETDVLSVVGLEGFAPGKQLHIEVNHNNSESYVFAVNHTFSNKQIEWFRAGSALNLIAGN